MNAYRAFGLEIHSELPLPEFLPGTGGIPDLTIAFGDVEPAPAIATAVTEWASVNADAVWLRTDPGDRFKIEAGSRITIDGDPSSSDAQRLVFLLASGFGAALQQRGLLTMHCGAVSMPDGLIGFLGRSGIGKSTTTSGLVAAGFPLVTDDILAIDTDRAREDGSLTAIPAFPSMKVCGDVLESRNDTTDYVSIPSPRNKYRVPAPAFDETPLPMAALFVLRIGPIDEVTVSDRLPTARAFRVLERETFRRRFIAPMGRRAEHFAQLTQLAKTVPVHVVRRPHDQATHEEVLAAVQAFIAALSAGAEHAIAAQTVSSPASSK